MSRPAGQDRFREVRFREVVLPHLGDGLALARWLTASRHDAEDIVQEACIRALAAIDKYDGRGARSWFLAIVRNAAFTWLKQNQPKGFVPVDDVSDADLGAAGGGTPDPEALLLGKLDEASVQAAVEALPHIFREVVVLRDLSGLSYKDIAAMLSLPIGTVMSRLARGRHLLAVALRGSAS